MQNSEFERRLKKVEDTLRQIRSDLQTLENKAYSEGDQITHQTIQRIRSRLSGF